MNFKRTWWRGNTFDKLQGRDPMAAATVFVLLKAARGGEYSFGVNDYVRSMYMHDHAFGSQVLELALEMETLCNEVQLNPTCNVEN